MFFKFWMNLQLFADGGDGGSGGEGSAGASATGVEDSADAGQKRLRELGVPESKIRNRASKAVGRMAAQQSAQAAAAAEEAPKGEDKEQPVKKSFKDVLAENPDYNEEVQNIIKARLKGAHDAQDNLAKLGPALEVLARAYKMDPQNLDFEALAQAVNNDDQYYETLALEKGVDLDTAKRDDQNLRRQSMLEQQRMRQHFDRMQQQGEELRKVFPGFNLQEELKNPAFARMTHPNVGVSVEDAYYAVHRQELQAAAMQVTAQRTAEKIANSIASGKTRPAEAGQSSQAASVASFDYKNASRAQRESLKAQIRAAAARGEKLYPGQM